MNDQKKLTCTLTSLPGGTKLETRGFGKSHELYIPDPVDEESAPFCGMKIGHTAEGEYHVIQYVFETEFVLKHQISVPHIIINVKNHKENMYSDEILKKWICSFWYKVVKGNKISLNKPILF